MWTRFQEISIHPLDAFAELDFYREHFIDAALWSPYVLQALSANGLSGAQVRVGIPGTCPAFIVDEKWVVKFFGALFDGGRSAEVEIEAALLLQAHPVLPVPKLFGHGRLAPPRANWDWPYLIFEYLPGESIGQVFGRLDAEEKHSLAGQLGGWVRGLHDIQLPPGGCFEPTWTGFESFLEGQRRGCAARQAEWACLPARLVEQVDTFLAPTEALFNRAARAHWIHADLTGDHLLGRVEQGHWITLGWIDFGDARIGSLYYELPALHLDLFQGDLNLLKAFLAAYGFTPPADFPRRALSACLLHQFNVLANHKSACQSAGSLDALAEKLWGI